MINREPVYITGHLHPDTDSVVSAIAYAFYKKTQGEQAVACRLGELNRETKWLLDRFGYEAPVLLKDARKTLAEIELDSPEYITPQTTVLETIRRMHECDRNSFAVLNEDRTIAGYVSKTDLANIALGDTAAEIELLRMTPLEDIVRTIDGKLIYSDEQTHCNGKVSIIAHNANGTSNYEIKDRIVIVGNDSQAHIDLIRRGAGILIAVWAEKISEDVIEAAKEYHCPIIISGHGSMNTSRYLYFAPPVSLIMTKNPVCFRSDMYAEDVGNKMLKTRYRSYPVIDEEGKLFGYAARYHVLNMKNRRIILVDHNEFSQSVHAIEKAQILEVVDHHRINDFATSQPVSFRNEIIGSTATIIATIFRENQILMPKELAGLLLGAILSDTLVFQSPTTTKKDRDAANILAALADLDIEQFAAEMFTSAAGDADLSISEMIVQDIKSFDINGYRAMISQNIVASVDDIRKRGKEIEADMRTLTNKKELDLLVVCFTSVMDDGSVFYSCGQHADICQEAFPDLPGETHSLQKGIYSRKKQILPALIQAAES